MKEKYKMKKSKRRILYLEFALFFLIFSFSFSYFVTNVGAGIGDNVTVESGVTIGKSNPNIVSIDIEAGSITLVPNDSRIVNCSVVLEDFDGDVDLDNVSAEFFHNIDSFFGDDDDNNTHYTNSSCHINLSYGDEYQALANCLFDVEYYANPGTWNCSVNVSDLSSYVDFDSNTTLVEELLAFGLPDTIDYGLINATYVSSEKVANVTNYGNVMANLSLSGYGSVEEDGYAFTCTQETSGGIPVYYEKFNLTESTQGNLTLSDFETNYSNLTSTPEVRTFNLDYRTDEVVNDKINSTYWRVYVPSGVGGSCSGTIIFGAVKANGI